MVENLLVVYPKSSGFLVKYSSNTFTVKAGLNEPPNLFSGFNEGTNRIEK